MGVVMAVSPFLWVWAKKETANKAASTKNSPSQKRKKTPVAAPANRARQTGAEKVGIPGLEGLNFVNIGLDQVVIRSGVEAGVGLGRDVGALDDHPPLAFGLLGCGDSFGPSAAASWNLFSAGAYTYFLSW